MHGITAAAGVLDRARFVVALTGAGISVDSGIPAFRGTQGLWDRYDPAEYATIAAFRADPEKVWGMLRELGGLIGAARPNPGHLALAELEQLDGLHAIVTQNVDGLHQAAGSRTVYEFHGNGARLACLACNAKRKLVDLSLADVPPRCACGAIMKPDVVFIGEAISDEALAHGFQAARTCQAMLVVGTSAEMYPAAQLPVIAKKHGAVLVEINPEPTPLTDVLTDIFIQAGAGEALPELVTALRALRGN